MAREDDKEVTLAMLATRVGVGLLALAAVGAACGGHVAVADDDPPAATTSLRDGFETPGPLWTQEQTDATVTLLAHDRSTRAAHEGRTSEHFKFNAGVGSSFLYSYALPRVPVADKLHLSLFVRSDRAGAQLFARVVLPSDIDPDTKAPSFLLVPGTTYENIDRWQRLELVDVWPSLERQARVLRASTRRPVRLEGAYIEQVVVNLFAGAGETEVFLDELVVSPVSPAVSAAFAAMNDRRKIEAENAPADLSPTPEGGPDPGGPIDAAAGPGAPAGSSVGPVRLDRNRLRRRAADGLYHDWVFTAIYAPGADVAGLRNAGFDVLIDDLQGDPKRFQEAVRHGFLLMPILPRGGDGELLDPERASAAAAAFPNRDAVLAWNLGDHLGRATDRAARLAELDRARALISLFHRDRRLVTGLVDDEVALFARAPRSLDLMGVRASAWASSLEPGDVYQFLHQRRDLSARTNKGALYWAMLPAAPPAEVATSVWGHDVPPAWGSPLVQPEQLRLMTYAALAAGYRGLAFRGDAELTRAGGRVLLLEMALLNAEIDLFESIVANGADPIPVYRAYDPDPPALPAAGSRVGSRAPRQKELKPLPGIAGASIGTSDKKGVLLVVADYAALGQFQPSQMARNDVKMTIIVPESAQAFEVSPGRFRVLERERNVGGTRITLPEFDTTALILITTDVAMAERVEAVVNSIRPQAAQMAIEQAELKHAWVTDTNGRLAADGHLLIDDKVRRQREENGGPSLTDQADLLNKSAENIKAARENLEREDFSTAWAEARRASRPLRILMRGLWDNALLAAIKANMDPQDLANEELLRTGRARHRGPVTIIPPTASAPLAAFNLLPQHYVWVDWMKNGRFGRNLLPSGTFDEPGVLKEAGWSNEGYQLEGVVSKVMQVDWRGKPNNRFLRMTVAPAEGKTIDELPPSIDVPAAAVRSPAVKVRAGQFLRISVFVQRKTPSVAGAGGVVVRDSIGGEALQFASTAAIPALTRVVLYRRAPADGDLTVYFGLAGYGEAVFDDLKIERVEGAPEYEPADVARLPRPDRPAPTTPVR